MEVAKAKVEALGRVVCGGRLCVSHFAALCRKFRGLERTGSSGDTRDVSAKELLQAHPSSAAWIEWDTTLRDEETNIGFAAHLQTLRSNLAASGVDLVQVLGTDSKVHAVLRGKSRGDVVIIVDGRGVPDGAASVMKGHVVAHAEDLTRMSSSVIRWLQRERYPAVAVPNSFSLEWLTDTGVDLGSGRQGTVRLMQLGTLSVAVKVRALLGRPKDEEAFAREAHIWEHLSTVRSTASPRLYATGTTADGAFGYIVTEVGSPLCSTLPVADPKRWTPVESAHFGAFFAQFPLVRQDPPAPVMIDTSTQRKAEVVHKMWSCVSQLHASGVLHRDIKPDNFVFIEDTLRIVDFGVAMLENDTTKARRGATRCYPTVALRTSHYDTNVDIYMLSCAIFAVINLANVYVSEVSHDAQAASSLRALNIHPTWTHPKPHKAGATPADTYLTLQRKGVEAIWRAYEGIHTATQAAEVALPQDTLEAREARCAENGAKQVVPKEGTRGGRRSPVAVVADVAVAREVKAKGKKAKGKRPNPTRQDLERLERRDMEHSEGEEDWE